MKKSNSNSSKHKINMRRPSNCVLYCTRSQWKYKYGKSNISSINVLAKYINEPELLTKKHGFLNIHLGRTGIDYYT